MASQKSKKSSKDGDKLVLRSFNPEFGDFMVDEDDQVEIVGVVKERFSKDAFVV